jgi:SAM-dependent methyltransferase
MLSLDQQNKYRRQYRRDHPQWSPATEIYADLVRHWLRPESLILDLGSGRGGLIEQLGHPLEQVVGLDPDLNSLQEHRLKDSHPALNRVNALSQFLPFTEKSFDLIFSSWVLEHLPKPQMDFSQIGRILRPGGVFVFITPNRQHPLTALNHLLGRFGNAQEKLVGRFYGRAAVDTFPAYYQANTAADLELLATMGNMHLAALQAIPDPSYLAFNQIAFRLSLWFDKRLSPERQIHLVGLMQRNSR